MNYMKDDVFFDTNIIVYAYDSGEPRKQAVCEKLIKTVYDGEISGFVSNQILGEVFITLTKKIERPLDSENAEKIVAGITDSAEWIKANYTHRTIKNAIRTVKILHTPFWDTVIAETMKENDIEKIYTENDKDFSKITGIKAINPFKGEL